MSPKYVEYQPNRKQKPRGPHPIWRGVGFMMIVLIPIISYAGVDVFLRLNGQNNWMPLPRDLIANQTHFLYRFIPDPMINIKVLLFVVFAFLLYMILMMFSFMITGIVMGGPEKNDPFYVPPTRMPRRRSR